MGGAGQALRSMTDLPSPPRNKQGALIAATTVLLVAGAFAAAALGIRVPAALSQGWGLVILLAVSPVLEEWLLRAGLHEALIQRFPASSSGWRSPVTAGVALVFGTLHALAQWNPFGLLTAAPAWLIGLCYSRQRSLLAAMCLHALANAALLAAMRLMPLH